jgi:hypothetical protein
MRKRIVLWVLAGTLGFGSHGPTSLAAADDPPPLQPPVVIPPGQPDATSATPRHEALATIPEASAPVHVDRAPPVPESDRPDVEPPEPGAQWIDGYWGWDPARKDFVWVPGTWRVPPPGKFWINGFWKRDEQGWSRVGGFWSDRKTDVRRDGPPSSAGREDRIGPAPGPDYFYVPGQYVPAGDGVTWRPGFWARSQPGWEWVPARWVRLSDGWTYREGHWERSANDLDSGRRHVVARPGPGSTSPFSPTTPNDSDPRAFDPSFPSDLRPLPETEAKAEESPTEPPDLRAEPAPGSTRVPLPGPPPGVVTPYPYPPFGYPGPLGNLPITDVDIAGGLHIQVVPGRLPTITNSPTPYYGGLPRVSVGVWNPLQGLLNGVLGPGGGGFR